MGFNLINGYTGPAGYVRARQGEANRREFAFGLCSWQKVLMITKGCSRQSCRGSFRGEKPKQRNCPADAGKFRCSLDKGLKTVCFDL
jgi:hypothetical protein